MCVCYGVYGRSQVIYLFVAAGWCTNLIFLGIFGQVVPESQTHLIKLLFSVNGISISKAGNIL